MFVSIYAATCPLVCRPHCNRTAVVMSAYKRAFRLALHALRILYLQIIFALLERSAAVDSGFHAALFVPTLCICKGFSMLHENGTYGAHFCTSLRARDAMVVWRCTLAKARSNSLASAACFTQRSTSWLSSWVSQHVRVRCLVKPRGTGHISGEYVPSGVPFTVTDLLR